VSECVFLYSSFVLLCIVWFRMAVVDCLLIRVFWARFPYLNIVELRAKAHSFLKLTLQESHLHIASLSLL